MNEVSKEEIEAIINEHIVLGYMAGILAEAISSYVNGDDYEAAGEIADSLKDEIGNLKNPLEVTVKRKAKK